MVHLPSLPGSPAAPTSLEDAVRAASDDLENLIRGGADGAVIENFGDAPFHPGTVPPITVAAMTAVAAVLRAHAPDTFLIGVNVLRNDAVAALSIAHVVGASFIRVNVHSGAVVSDQGILIGTAHETLRLRASLGARVSILADVAVKHARPLVARPIVEEAMDLVERGLADGILVTGSRTGSPADRNDLAALRRAGLGVPILVASGVDVESAKELRAHCDGFIVGTWLKKDGRMGERVDRERVRAIANLLRRAG
jgi:membrane complex biogenesis BtpA family protein